MSPPPTCGCALCILEPRLLAALSSTDAEVIRELLSGSSPLDPVFVESALILAFLPTLHATVRRVGKQPPGLSHEDITQPTLSVLLQYLRSDELHSRQSHYAFAISRAVKRKVFEWTQRESRANETAHPDPFVINALTEDDSFERHLLLRHFLHRCVTKGFITNSESNLLIDFKLEGGSLDPANGSDGNSSNAIRQKLKRLLRKLRRIATTKIQARASACTPSRQATTTCHARCHPPPSRNPGTLFLVLSVTRSDLVPARG